MSSYTLAPYEQRQYFDDDGAPLAGGKVYTWVTGTSTPATTYTTSTGTPNTNPIILSSSGRCQMYLDTSVVYKITMTTSAGVPVGNTIDPVQPMLTSSAALGEAFSFGSNSSVPITSTGVSTGATIASLQPGSSAWLVDSNNLPGTYALRATGIGPGSSHYLEVYLVNLSDGAPATAIASCGISSTTGEVVTSSAITFPAGGSSKTYGIKAFSTNGVACYLMGAQIVRTA